MFWPLMSAALVLFFCWVDLVSEHFFGVTTLFVPLFMLGGSIVGLAIAAVIGNILPVKRNPNPVITKLASLKGEKGTSGPFFLGSGNINTKLYYFFYKKIGRGYQSEKTEANDKVMIFEEKREDGELRTYSRIFKKGWFGLFAFCYDDEPEHDFIIPEGSLKRGFTL